MIENKPKQKTAADADAGSSRWAVGVALAYSLVVVAFGLVLLPDLLVILANPPWDPAWVRHAVPSVMAIFGLISTYLIWSGRHHPRRQVIGAWLLVISMILGSLAADLLAQGYGMLLGMLILMVGVILADQLLAGRPSWIPGLSQASLMVGLCGLSATLSILIELFWTGWRAPQVPFEVTAGTTLTVVFALLFIAYLALRFRSYRLSTKLALGFLLVALLVGLVVGGFALRAVTTSLTQAVGEGVSSLAESQARSIGDALARQLDGLTVLGLSDPVAEEVVSANEAYAGRSETEIQADIARLDQQWKDLVVSGQTGEALIQDTLNTVAATEMGEYAEQFPENVEMFITDLRGGLVASTGVTSDYYQADEGWWQSAYNGGQGAVYISPPEFDASSQTLSILMAVPVLNEDTGEFAGVLRTTINLAYLQELVELVKLGQTGELELLFPNPDSSSGTSHVLAGGYNDLAASDAASYAAVESLNYGQAPIEEVESLISVGKIAATVGRDEIDSLGWRLAAHQQVDEALAGVQAQTRATLLLVLVTMSLAALGGLGLARFLTGPITRLTATAQQVERGDLQAQARVETADEVGELAEAFNSMTAQVRGLVGSLEGRVAERTQALKTSLDVSQRLSTLLDQQDLLTAIVEDVAQSFAYYYAQVYLFDEPGERLVLAGGTGEPGRVMLNRGHEVLLGRGLVGRAAASKQPVLVSDVSTESDWLPNPLLPETHSEAAVPILLGDQLLGVLDVQDDVIDGLGEKDRELLQGIANQIAIGLQNARQVAETENALVAAHEAQEAARLLSEFAPEAIVVVDVDRGLFLDPNENAVRLYGLTREQLLEVGPAQTSPEYQPDGQRSSEKAAQMIQEALQGGNPVFEWTHLNAQGGEIPCEIRLVNLPAAGRRWVRASVTDITERIQAQQAVARQAQELAIVAQVATRAAAETDPQRLLSLASEQLMTGFNLYHAQVYLLNATGDVLELAAGAGEAGRNMLARAWKIPLDRPHSLVARAAREGQGVLVNDVRAEPDFQANPFLPHTAAEMAVPMLAAGRLLGVLDLQSDLPGAFSAADLSIHSTLAAQLAVALQNANQFQATRQSERLVRTIIDTTPDWIYIKDCDHRYLLANQAFAEGYGVPAQAMIGKDDLQLGLPEIIVKGDPARGFPGFWAQDRAVLDSGMPQMINNQPIPLGGVPRIFDVYRVPLFDPSGDAIGVLTFARDVTERQRLQQETQERLAEIDALYRSISRESWAEFHQAAARQTAFFFDRASASGAVLPADDKWLAELSQAVEQKAQVVGGNGQKVLAAPLLLRGDPIGALAVELDPSRPLTADENRLLVEMTDQVALALESVRLFEQTQLALGETETLYNIIAEMNQAKGYQDILSALAARTLLGGADSLLLMAVFDRPKADAQPPAEAPEWIIPVAWNSAEALQIAARYPLSAFEPTPDTLYTTRPAILPDLAREARLDRITRTLFQDVFRARSSIILPLMLGGQSIGFVQGYFSQATNFAADEVQRLVAVAGQAAIAVQSRLLLEQAQARARQEQRIRQVSAQVSSAADVDTILRRAVEQVGRALGASAYIYLGSQTPEAQTGASADGGPENPA